MHNKNEEVIIFLESKLNEFIKKELPNFSLANKEVYSNDVVYGSDSSDNGLNPYLKYEADVKVKLGGYLNNKIFKKYGYKQYTINSEMPYKYLTDLNSISTHAKIDLSLHRINQKGNILWINKKASINSLIAGIEIKLLNYKKPDSKIDEEMKKDINKLQVLKNVERYLFILVESDDNICIKKHENYLKLAKRKGIKLFTNSKIINVAYFD